MKFEKLRSGGGPGGAFLVTFEAGDTVTADDGVTVTFDYVDYAIAPELDRWFPGWRSGDWVIAVALLPGDGLAVADGTNLAAPHAYASLGDDGADARVMDSVIAVKADATPTVRLNLIAGAEVANALDGDRAHRVLGWIGPLHDGNDVQRFSSLPETFTTNIA